MTVWVQYNPVRLQFGPGVFDKIGDVIGGRRYLLVTHPDAPLMPWRERLARLAGHPAEIVDQITPNPSLDLLRGVCERLAAAPAFDLVVALGGGSVIDAAKFIAAGHGRFDPVAAYLETGRGLPRKALPLVAVPTTAGTGSDLTKWATIWDPVGGRKLSLNRDDLYAEAALVDPKITATLPWPMTRATGLDALSHALESIWNVNATPVTRAFAVEAARNIMSALPRLQTDLGDASARAAISLGATQAGLAFSNTQTALAHNISYPITLTHGITHGIACSFCLPEVMQTALGVSAETDAALSAIFGDSVSAPQRMRRFLAALDVPSEASAMGIGTPEWVKIVDDAFDGPRGRNFIGRRKDFPLAAIAV